MKKIICIIIILLIVLSLFFYVSISKIKLNNSEIEEEQNGVVISTMDINNEKVFDNCINEANNYYANYQEYQERAMLNEEKIKEVMSDIIDDENVNFLIKRKNGYIIVYYLDENNNEYLYKETELSTEYLSESDEEELEKGIVIKGETELNKILENFE